MDDTFVESCEERLHPHTEAGHSLEASGKASFADSTNWGQPSRQLVGEWVEDVHTSSE